MQGERMKRTTGAMLLLAAVSGCMSTAPEPAGTGQYMSHAFDHGSVGCMSGQAMCAASVPGFQGPNGAPVALAAPYTAAPPGGADMARQMVRQSVPLELVQQVQQAGFSPDSQSHVTPAQFCAPGMNCPPNLMPSGLAGMSGGPGMGGGNPFVPGAGAPGAVAAVGALTGGPSPYPAQRTEVRFTGPNGMRVTWFAPTADGRPGFGSQYLETPGRYNFLQAAIYRLKLSDIPNRPGVELYPTLEVVPGNAKTAAFLAHTSVPLTFTEEDFNQVQAGNYLVKVIYLPDPQFQDLATTGVDEVISSRLEPGVDPIAEAHRRGSILAVVRLGNIDLEAPNTPAMDAPSPYTPRPGMPPAAGAPAGMIPPGLPVPQGVAPGSLPPELAPNRPVGMGPPQMLPAAESSARPTVVPAVGFAPPSAGAPPTRRPPRRRPDPSCRRRRPARLSWAGPRSKTPASGRRKPAGATRCQRQDAAPAGSRRPLAFTPRRGPTR